MEYLVPLVPCFNNILHESSFIYFPYMKVTHIYIKYVLIHVWDQSYIRLLPYNMIFWGSKSVILIMSLTYHKLYFNERVWFTTFVSLY